MSPLIYCVIFALCFASLKSETREAPSYCNTICYNDVHKAVSNHTLIIDVRTKQEVAESGMIPTSINIPLSCLKSSMDMSKSDFKDEYSHSKPKKRDLIIVTGRRNKPNTDAIDILCNLGYNRVVDYVGGYDDWERHSCEKPAESSKSQEAHGHHCPGQADKCEEAMGPKCNQF